MANHLAMDKVLAVKQLHAAGRSWRDIARTLVIDRKTVARILHENHKIVGGLAPPLPTEADSLKEAKPPIGSGPVQDAELQLTAQPFPKAGDRLAKRSRSACRAFTEVVRTTAAKRLLSALLGRQAEGLA